MLSKHLQNWNSLDEKTKQRIIDQLYEQEEGCLVALSEFVEDSLDMKVAELPYDILKPFLLNFPLSSLGIIFLLSCSLFLKRLELCSKSELFDKDFDDYGKAQIVKGLTLLNRKDLLTTALSKYKQEKYSAYDIDTYVPNILPKKYLPILVESATMADRSILIKNICSRLYPLDDTCECLGTVLERSKNVGLVKFVMNWITSAYELMIKEFSTELDGLLVSVILHVLDNEDMCIREIGKKFIDSRINALSLI